MKRVRDVEETEDSGDIGCTKCWGVPGSSGETPWDNVVGLQETLTPHIT
jgi:hypothetical protein